MKSSADNFNNYFADTTKALKLKKHPNFDAQSLSSVTENFKNYEYVIKSNKGMLLKRSHFTLFSKDNLLKAIKSLSSDEASLFVDIPIKVLKNSIQMYSEKTYLKLQLSSD